MRRLFENRATRSPNDGGGDAGDSGAENTGGDGNAKGEGDGEAKGAGEKEQTPEEKTQSEREAKAAKQYKTGKDNTDTQDKDGRPVKPKEGEDKPKEGEGEDGDKDGDKDEDKPAKPEDMDAVPDKDTAYHIELPEGVELDQPLLDRLTPTFREAGITHTQAQALTEAYIESANLKATEAEAKSEETVKQWEKDAKADKEIGGDNFKDSVAAARKALDRFGSDEVKKLLDDSGLGSHKAIIRLFRAVGTAMSDDTIPQATGEADKAPQTREARAAAFYQATTPTAKKGGSPG